MATITIDGRQFDVDDTENLLAAALSKGFDLPYFCWHPELHSVGACRQCAVKSYRNDEDEQGMIVMACMTPCADGGRFEIADEQAAEMRRQVIEWLMINHPHDCPVCEEGGECHLQDMTLMAGHTERRYRGAKRTHKNQDLGPFINHEMNRCIACYRCVRYYRDYADGDDLRALGSHNNVYFGRDSDGAFDNEFSGNLVEVCPTGVFTDKTLGAHYNRKWDMQNAPGICSHCSLGCNTSPGSRQGLLKRIQNRYHGEINHYFLCDRGRFGAGFVNRDDRPRQPLVRNASGVLEPREMEVMRDTMEDVFANARGVVGVGSPRASLEDNFALRHLVGAANFCNGMNSADSAASLAARDAIAAHAERVATLREVESCDAVLILGEDVTQTAPRLALSLRQARRNKHLEHAAANKIPKWHARAVRDIGQDNNSPIFSATTAATRLDDIVLTPQRMRPAAIAELGFAVAHALDNNAPEVKQLAPDTRALVDAIAATLKGAKKPLIIAGTSLGDPAIVKAAANATRALAAVNQATRLFVTLAEANSLGMAMMEERGIDHALTAIEDGSADTLVVMQNCLYERAPEARAEAAIKKAKNVIVLDHSMTRTVGEATHVLPAGSFAEADGTLVNNEARAQRFFQVFIPDAPMQEGWRWAADLAEVAGHKPDWLGMDDLIKAIVAECPQFAGIEHAAPSQSFRKFGMRFPRSPHRFSGRTALYANVDVRERRPEVDQDSPLAYSMEGYYGEAQPPSTIAYAWSPGWDSNQAAITRFQDEVGGHLKGGDPGVRLLAAPDGNGEFSPADIAVVDGWQAVPMYHIFGSESQSARAPAIAERMPKAEYRVNATSAKALGLAAGDSLELTMNGETHAYPLAVDPSLPDRTIGVPVGMHGVCGLPLPMEVTP
ncbi:NADH-quinone oxidoreductase subunit NuoG [Salinisphaera sp.]|uniref:NADH-quinone oxidoreductase subunit NuoG n=1 Tax=Salinisphaera sp. TaxID=1914330 RepID=UPI002D7911C0|nr:NADH-quinone oxidoreductase subunit NuoG [Salinisphaera sp.]HET7314825.1 NADH-quinone oxidoreductase subunit NuoG [Salinisphaera sp.]